MSKAPAVDYALRIIELFAESQREIGIADIDNALGINKNAASRVLEALLEYNWIYPSDRIQKKYRFTLKPFSIVSKCTPHHVLAETAENELRKVNEQLGDSVYLGIKNKDRVLYLVHIDSTKEVRVSGRVGGEYPLNTSAPGKILLAYGEHAKEFDPEAERIKKQGYALDIEEFSKGILCIACPIYDNNGQTVASVGISSLTIYDDPNSLVENKLPVLKRAASRISANLGFSEDK